MINWPGSKITPSVQGKLKKLNYLFYHLRKNQLKTLYNPIVWVSYYGPLGGSTPRNPINLLWNRVCGDILSLPSRTSKNIIYPEMNEKSLENLYEYWILMFVFKNKTHFYVHESGLNSRFDRVLVAAHPGCREYRSRLQATYMGTETFNRLPQLTRNKQKIGLFKKDIQEHL